MNDRRIILKNRKPLASGNNRDVFTHPLDDALLIKIFKPNAVKKYSGDSVSWQKRLFRRYKHYIGFLRECREHLVSRLDTQNIPDFVQTFIGFVDTDLGLGLVTVAERDHNGAYAKTLRTLIRDGLYDDEAALALEKFKKAFYSSSIIITDTNLGNLVYSYDGNQYRFVVIDGYGEKNLIPFNSIFRRCDLISKRKRLDRLQKSLTRELNYYQKKPQAQQLDPNGDVTLDPSPHKLALEECVRQLHDGPWNFIRLRGNKPIIDAIDDDDIDLLGSRESLQTLLKAAFGWARSGKCHLRIKSNNRNKTELHFISIDGKHRLDLDIWIELWQINNRKSRLTYQDCKNTVIDPQASIQHLPAELEISVFIHHLVSKRKELNDPKQLERLETYSDLTRSANQAQLADILESIIIKRRVSKFAEKLTLDLIENRINISRFHGINRIYIKLILSLKNLWFRPSGKLRLLTMMGCDGSGKTTLCSKILESRNDIRTIYTGKHLYRKWFFYKLLVIFVRPLLFQGREKFDDSISPIIYILACIRLRIKLLFIRKGIILIDRSIIDFLFINRKSEQPHFSRLIWLSKLFGIRLTHVHIIVPFEQLAKRKLEITECGHKIYDDTMFHHFSTRIPTDHVVFSNHDKLDQSNEALNLIIEWLKK